MGWSDDKSTFTATGCNPGTAAHGGKFTVDIYGQQQGLAPTTKLTAWLVHADPANPPDLDPASAADLPAHETGHTVSTNIPAGGNTWQLETRFHGVKAGKYQLLVLTGGAAPQHALVDTSAPDGLFQVT